MDRVRLCAEIQEDEGRKNHGYFDTSHIWSGGVGHNIVAHHEIARFPVGDKSVIIPDSVIEGWLNDDINEAIKCARSIFPTYDVLPDNVQRTLVNISFCLAHKLAYFHDLKEAITAKDWQAAALAIIDSKFAKQAPHRCMRLAARIVSA